MPGTCTCQSPPFNYLDYIRENLGEDRHGADAAIETCRRCGSTWLVYVIEEPHRTKAGRWWRAPVDPAERKNILPASARQFIERSCWCFIGGSFYDGPPQKKFGPVTVR